MTDNRLSGTVLRARGGVYEVETPDAVIEASLRGRLKREERTGERVVAGDRVEIAEAAGDWTIEKVHDRRTALLRKAPGKAPRPKVIVANVDLVLIVFAVARPEPHLRMLDRFLVLCEASGLDALVVANKVDLVGEAAARSTFGLYEEIGYPVLYTSVKQNLGIDALRERLCGSTAALSGPSGVGKSSLLNSVQPGLALRVASISDAVQKGRHTTVTAQLIPLECGGYVADTPGLRELGLWGIAEEDMGGLFPEFRPHMGSCRYGNSCTHTHEPACAVKDAVQSGEIPAPRYDSYCRMMADEVPEEF
ncbi:MAG: ribosome small subunit-dependent GTPase A [Gemmatimonadetes bacterium]|nr:ribosome small subunit-dependent GTPase A [Gemmatimonadota bacterium]